VLVDQYFCIKILVKKAEKRSSDALQPFFLSKDDKCGVPLPVWRHLASFCAYFCHFRHKKIQRIFKNDVKRSGASTQTCMYQSRCVPDAPLPVWRHLASFCAYFCHFRHKKIQRIFKNDVKRSGAST
jgi:hypothetical protein